ncbi:helix-turn-helix domain-containing protein [Paenibacillus sp. Lou8.1]|uniref:helix-turn-helix domain-containing protein n=1 Tax=Paenibacillus sp. Lou8.1 TaxID=2962041 RepID=UPI0020B868C7|nr:helix-turn-helix domain-containing protein [Paenibacillus sp. Lou8.1]
MSCTEWGSESYEQGAVYQSSGTNRHVLYCLAHDHDYRKTAEQYQVSYHQVYQWVKKYKEHGPDDLCRLSCSSK